jgi:hypothetical protein
VKYLTRWFLVLFAGFGFIRTRTEERKKKTQNPNDKMWDALFR